MMRSFLRRLPVRSSSRGGLGAGASGAALLAGLAIWNFWRARAAERRSPPAGKFVEVEGVRLHYLERGSGAPLVFVHGNGTSSEDFALSGLIDAAAKRFRVIAFDRPGFGYSERPRTRIWTPGAQAALLMRALAQLGVEKPIVVGHSWGCMVTAAMALDFPGQLRGIVLLSGYYFPTLRLDALLAVPAIPILGDIMRWTLSPVLGRALVGPVYRKLFAPAPVPAHFARGFASDMSLRPSQIRATAADTGLMQIGAKSLRQRYRELRLPVSILAGSGDKIATTGRQSERLHGLLAHSRFRSLRGAGHMIQHIDPDAIMREIDEMAAKPGGGLAAVA